MITSSQMKAWEEYAESQGVSTLDLMENAGRGFAAAVKKKYDLNGKRIVIFCGTGNNAGDGFVAARYFAGNGEEERAGDGASEASGHGIHDVLVLFFGAKEKLPEEAQRNYERLKLPITLVQIQKKEDLEKFHFQKNVDLVLVDALLGTGVKGEVREPLSFAVDLFNALPGIKVAVDVPSGLDPDTGEAAEKECQVDLIVTFHDLKPGLEQFKDKTVVVDIGIPK